MLHETIAHGFDWLPVPAQRRLSGLRYRIVSQCRRFGEGWRYATGRMTQSDAYSIGYECQGVAGSWPLENLGAFDVLERCRNLYGDRPELEDLAFRACERVASKGDSSGDMTGAAEDWAMELVAEYAEQDGLDLVEIDADAT